MILEDHLGEDISGDCPEDFFDPALAVTGNPKKEFQALLKKHGETAVLTNN